MPEIDRLENHEFTLDVEDRQRLIEESDKEVEMVIHNTILLFKIYVTLSKQRFFIRCLII